MLAPPTTIHELLERADGIAGRTIGEVAERLDEAVPADLTRHKGWVGILIENALGASAGNRPEPDFVEIGVELKTIPVTRNGKPLESTYVCTVPLAAPDEVEWATSTVRKKLRHVLWVPVLAERSIPLPARTIGQSMLWKPDEDEERMLREDWEQHLQVIREGWVENIRGKDGDVLQIRPKAADASKLTWSVDERGESIMTQPRGFYLRTLFTEYLIRKRFG